MHTSDPILKVEEIARELNDGAGKYAQPALHRYPLLFSFLIVFSTAAIMYGFELIVGKIQFFKDYPISLILIGAGVLFFTGMLYKALGKVD
ncbi:MAG: hypothetical protein ACWGHO_03275 [Candidatus Moraniibacteriota bacterium]